MGTASAPHSCVNYQFKNMPKINPTKKTRSDGTQPQQGPMKEILGTELYDEMMEETLDEDSGSDEEEQQSEQQSSWSFAQSQEMDLEIVSEEEEDEEQEDEEVEASQVLPRRSPRKRKAVVIPGTQAASQEVDDASSLPIITHKPSRDRAMLSEDVEHDLIDWLEANPCLYDKSMAEYKITEKKRRIFAAKAESLKEVGITMTGNELSKWFVKMCGIARKKMEKLPSGSGSHISAQRRRLLEVKKKLAWLTTFVERTAGETPGTPGKTTKRPLASRPGNAPPMSLEAYPSDDEQGPSMTSTPSASQITSSGKSKGSSSGTATPRSLAATPRTSITRTAARSTARPPSKKRPDSSSLIREVRRYEDVCDQVIRNLDQTVMPTETRARKMFMDSFFMTVIEKMPSSLWADFQDDYMKLITSYRKKCSASEAANVTSKSPHPPSSRQLPGPSTSQ